MPQSLQVSINGVDQLNFNESSEFTADINGGGGYYEITWYFKNLPGGNWVQVQHYFVPVNYFIIGGENYYFYDNEHKYNLVMPDNNIELMVEIYDYDLDEFISATKVVAVNPDPVTFINHIQSSESYGSLILNENKSDPISSGDNRNLIFGNNYTIRTDELPFNVNWNSAGKTEKHHRWEFSPEVFQLNYSFMMQGTTPLVMKSRFTSTESAVINTVVDGINVSGLNIEFNDPWFYYEDASGNWFQSDEFKTYSSPLSIQNNSVVTYGGVFLNQDYNVPGQPYYSVQSPLTQTVNLGGTIGTRTFNFQNWSTTGGVSLQQVGSNPPGYDQKAVVFTSTNATVNANLKGQLMSNDQNGISSNSQRKLVRTDNGRYHSVYESMGTVWYAQSVSSDFYGDWYPDQIMLYNGKNPAMDYDGNIVNVVCEEYDPQVGGDANIWLLTFTLEAGGRYENTEAEVFATYPNSYYGSAKPVITYNTYGNDGEIFIAYRTSSNGKMKQRTKWYIRVLQYWYWGSESDIPQTNGDCVNPAVTGYSPYICIAYENFGTIYFTEAKKVQVFGVFFWNFIRYPVNLSSGSGFNLNRYPAIS